MQGSLKRLAIKMRNDRREGSWIAAFALCVVVSVLVLFPLVVTAVGGLRNQGELFTAPFSIPRTFHWENYGQFLNPSDPFWHELFNSAFTAVATMGLVLVVACPAAFVLGRRTFPGRDLLFNIFLIGMLFPLTVAVLPLYIEIRQLQLLNSLWGLILPQAAFALPISILILRNFFRAIPSELEDAAIVDGASTLTFFLRILLPLARPAISVVSILAVVSSWNNLLLPFLILNDDKQWTLPVRATEYTGGLYTDWTTILAFSTLSLIPAVIFYLIAERQIVAGLTAGAVKG